MTSPRLPRTTWEYSLSAAGELVGWHLPLDDEEPEPDARETAVLLAAAVVALAADAGVSGPQVAALPLAAPAGQTSLLTTLHDHALPAPQACPADGLGSGERAQLLAVYGTPQWSAAQTVAEHHVQDSAGHGCPHPTISDRARDGGRPPRAAARQSRRGRDGVMVTLARDVAERGVALLGWAGDVRIVPDGDGTEGTEARSVHDAEAWWLAITVDEASGAALARTGAIDLGGTHLAAYATSMPAPAEDTGAVVLAVTVAREDLDGFFGGPPELFRRRYRLARLRRRSHPSCLGAPPLPGPHWSPAEHRRRSRP
ncbi:hypothetical protein AB0D11_46215 [Streptomyces monashensis]|uniref:hypothetical protein n=1 Tax=Streptomyces monashensis TaxID=1678012 RepID=UPI0033F9BC6C